MKFSVREQEDEQGGGGKMNWMGKEAGWEEDGELDGRLRKWEGRTSCIHCIVISKYLTTGARRHLRASSVWKG